MSTEKSSPQRAVWETCIAIVESEPEAPGPIPPEFVAIVERVGLEEAVRRVVQGTKKNIVSRLKKMEGTHGI